MRRHAAALVLLLAAGVLACGESRPNVLLVTVDTLRADHLGAYGFPLDVSPKVDALAAEGVVFEAAVAAATSTAPAHASILTSRHVREHSIGYRNGDTRLEGGRTLAEAFREAGYATAAFVSNAVLRREIGLDRGFDVYDDELPHPERQRRFVFERGAEDTTRRALAWLENAAEPFFLWVHYQDPHGPYTPPEEFAGRFRVERAPGEAPLPRITSDGGLGGVPPYQQLPGLALPSEYRSRYADEIAYADRWIGELVSAVDARSEAKGAVVLLTSDHGESFGEADRWFVHGHATTPDLAHVPMIVRAPGVPPGRRAEAVAHVDVMPTLLELAGLEPPEDASGIALGPPLRGGSPLPDRIVYCDIGRELAAYRADSFARARDLPPLWVAKPSGAEPAWSTWRWQPGRSFAESADADAIGAFHRDAIRRHYESTVPMIESPPPDAEHRARLKALGYAE